MIFFGFLRWKWQRDKGQRKSQLTHWCAHTLKNAQPHSKNSWWLCVWVHLSVHAAHMWVSADSNILYLKIPLLLNKTCSLKWRKDTRESIIQLSRFPLSLQTEKNKGSDHWIGVGAGERDCFYQHKLCFNRQYSAVTPFGWQSCWVAKVWGWRKTREPARGQKEISGRKE